MEVGGLILNKICALFGWIWALKFRLEMESCSTRIQKSIIYGFNLVP